EGQRDPHDAVSGLLWNRLRRVLGREAEPRDVLPARLRGPEPVRFGELLGVELRRDRRAGPLRIAEIYTPPEPAPEPRIPDRHDLLRAQFEIEARAGRQDRALRVLGAAVAAGVRVDTVSRYWAGA